MKNISIFSIWLSKISIFCAIATVILYLISDSININGESIILIFGLSTMILGSLGLMSGIIGNLKKHELQEVAQKGFKYGAYSMLILFISLGILFVTAMFTSPI